MTPTCPECDEPVSPDAPAGIPAYCSDECYARAGEPPHAAVVGEEGTATLHIDAPQIEATRATPTAPDDTDTEDDATDETASKSDPLALTPNGFIDTTDLNTALATLDDSEPLPRFTTADLVDALTPENADEDADAPDAHDSAPPPAPLPAVPTVEQATTWYLDGYYAERHGPLDEDAAYEATIDRAMAHHADATPTTLTLTDANSADESAHTDDADEATDGRGGTAVAPLATSLAIFAFLAVVTPSPLRNILLLFAVPYAIGLMGLIAYSGVGKTKHLLSRGV